MIKLDIGCSYHKLDGYIGVDLERGPDVDIIADLHALPFRESSIDVIHSRHTLEHVDDPHQCISEIYRVSISNGRIIIIVPHYSNHAYWADMTHKRPFSIRSFEYFDLEYAGNAGFPVYLPEVNLKAVNNRLIFWPERIYINKTFIKKMILKTFDRLISGLANINPFLCERSWCHWVRNRKNQITKPRCALI